MVGVFRLGTRLWYACMSVVLKRTSALEAMPETSQYMYCSSAELDERPVDEYSLKPVLNIVK